MDSVWQDVRLGFRALFKAPLFTVAVVLTLGRHTHRPGDRIAR